MEQYPELATFGYPGRGEGEVLASIKVQGQLRNTVVRPPPTADIEKAVSKLLGKYPESPRVRQTRPTYAELIWTKQAMKQDSSPGVGHIPDSPETRLVDDGLVADMTLYQLCAVEAIGKVLIDLGWVRGEWMFSDLHARRLAYFFVENGISQTIRFFIKNEPHPLRKMKTQRFRLIANVALEDNVTARVLFGALKNWYVANHAGLPERPGMGFEDSDAVSLLEALDKFVRSFVDSDLRGWDLHVRRWQWQALALQFWQLDAPLWWRQSAVGMCLVWACPLFCTPQGQLLTFADPSVQASGRWVTSMSNSIMRVQLSFVVQILRLCQEVGCYANGDDALEMIASAGHYNDHVVSTVKALYAELGHELKNYSPATRDSFEFCSHRYTAGVAIPTQPWKSIYRLWSGGSPTCEQHLGITYFLRRHPNYTTWLRAGLLGEGGAPET